MNWDILVGLVLTALLLGIIIIPILSLVKIALILRRQEEFAGRLQDIHRLLFRSAATASPPVPTPQPVKPVEPAKSVVSAMPPVVKSASVVKTQHIPQAVGPKLASFAPRREAIPESPSLPPEPNPFEQAACRILTGIWNWIIVGAEHKPEGVSMEYAVATNWLLRLGVLILVIGIGFFLRYSIEHDLIGPLGRVTLSTLTGAAMLAGGMRLLGKKYHLLGQGLLGGGLATLYFSAFAASNFYHLISPVHAFGLMAIITIGAGGMAVRFNSLLVAVLGMIGGYGTPVMLSIGEVQFVGLFSYMLLLGCGIFWIAGRKNWRLLNFLSFACTYGLFFAAMDRHYSNEYFWQVMPFLATFFVLFSTMVFIHNLVNRQPSNLLELIGLLTNAGIFFGAGFMMIDRAYSQEWTAALTLGLATFYVLHVYYLLIRGIHDRNLLISFIGLAAFFLVVTIPLILSREWITVCWALEALILLWMAGKLESEFLRHVAYLLYAIMLGRFFFLDMERQFGGPVPSPGMPLGKYLLQMLGRLVSSGISIASLGAAFRLLTKPSCKGPVTVARGDDIGPLIGERWAMRTLITLTVAMLFLYMHLELNRTVGCLCAPLRLPVLTLLWVAMCGYLLVLYATALRPELLVLLGLFTAGALIKLLFVDLASWGLMFERNICYARYSGLDASMRLLDFGAIIAFMGWAFLTLRRRVEALPAGWFMGYTGLALLFLYTSLELNTFLGVFIPGLRTGGITILWSAFALSFILFGILKQVAALRYVGLALFVVVAWKIFFFDLSHLQQLYRIIAFTVLGVVLLCGSFVYLKYRQAFAVRRKSEP